MDKRDLPDDRMQGYRSILDSIPRATAICDSLHMVRACNPAFREMFFEKGIENKSISLGQTLSAGRPFNTLPDFQTTPHTCVRTFRRMDGSEFQGGLMIGCDWEIDGVRLRTIQIAEVDSANFDLQKSTKAAAAWRNASEASHHGVWDIDYTSGTWFYSDGWKRMRGIPTDVEFVPSEFDLLDRVHPDDYQRAKDYIELQILGNQRLVEFAYRERHADGHWVWILSRGGAVEWDESGKPSRFAGTDVEITALKEEEERKAAEITAMHNRHVADLADASWKTEQARKRADIISRTDTLTGIANRRVFSEELKKRTANLAGAEFALMFIDLNRFKLINDLYGHQAGDFVICEIALRLKNAIPGKCTLARLGGDEFAIILNAGPDKDLVALAMTIANGIVEKVSEPIMLKQHRLHVGASIGIALYPDHGKSAEELMRAADIAMYGAKKKHTEDYTVYNHQMGLRRESQNKLEEDLREAVRSNAIEPHFQPILDLTCNRIVGFEILARWQRRGQGPVGADVFIPMVEQFGLMRDHTITLLRKACHSARDWPDNVYLNMNVSAREICDPALPDRIFAVLDEVGFDAKRLGIEITESTQMGDLTAAVGVTKALRKKGIRVLLDDFGIGFSGFDYLRRFELDSLKLDRSFILNSNKSREDREIVQSFLELSNRFGLSTIAEGIETLELHDRLRRSGCQYGQGYFYSKAVPAEQAKILLDTSVPAVTGAG